MGEPPSRTKKNYKDLISKKAEEKRRKNKAKPLNELDDFNIGLMKMTMGMGESGNRRLNMPKTFSEKRMHRYDGFMIRKSAVKNTSRLPRERKMHTLSHSRLSRMRLKPMASG